MKLFKNNQYGRSLLSKYGADEQIFSSNVYKQNTRARKCQSDAPQYGRSMVEMLGVLAIIGVLSVGGIAGYSKAMFKQKANKTMDIISHAVARVAELDTMNLGGEINGAQDAKKLGIIPDCDVNYVDVNGDTGERCPLPLGEFWVDFINSDNTNTLFGEFYINFTQEPFDSCVMFFNSEIYKHVPEEWWLPINDGVGGFIEVYTENADKFVYGKSSKILELGAKSTISSTDILTACEICKNSQYCHIFWSIRNEL